MVQDAERPVEEMTDDQIRQELVELRSGVIVGLTGVSGPIERYRELREELLRRQRRGS